MKHGLKIAAKHKKSRSVGVNIWGTPNSSFNTRSTKPGQHGKSKKRSKLSSYALHLKEKQKLRFFYGMKEKQFRSFFEKAYKTGKNIFDVFTKKLESRLDIFVYRAKLASTVFEAKQLISHKHILVNNKVVSIASYLLKEGDVVKVKDKMKTHVTVVNAQNLQHKETPGYYEVLDDKSIKLSKLPSFEDVVYPFPLNSSLIVEYYSRKI